MIVGTGFESLPATSRAAWLDTYYDDNEQPTGWDEDPEDDVDDIDAMPEWPDSDFDSDFKSLRALL